MFKIFNKDTYVLRNGVYISSSVRILRFCYVWFSVLCFNEALSLSDLWILVSGFTGNATLVGSDVIIYCEHSSFNESETGIRITDNENNLATCMQGNCFGGYSK